MAGYFSENGARIVHGARADFYIKDLAGVSKQIGYAQGITLSWTIGQEPVRVIGSLDVVQHEPVTYDVEFSCRMFALFGASLKKMQIEPLPTKILDDVEMEVDIKEKGDSETFYKVTGVKFSGGSLNVEAGTLQGQDIRFVARRVKVSDIGGDEFPAWPGI